MCGMGRNICIGIGWGQKWGLDLRCTLLGLASLVWVVGVGAFACEQFEVLGGTSGLRIVHAVDCILMPKFFIASFHRCALVVL